MRDLRKELRRFGKAELKAVESAREAAVGLIGDFYALAPREWERLRYEVRTLRRLAPQEICDRAFAQVLCYDCVKRVGDDVVEQYDLYRICLQDHRILRVAECGGTDGKLDLESMLLYLLTHELVHVVRFSQQLQRLDLEVNCRGVEELSVEKTTRRILAPLADRALEKVLAACAAPAFRTSARFDRPSMRQ